MTDHWSKLLLWLLRAIAQLPYPVVRALGNGLGRLLFWTVRPRRRVALINLSICMPELSPTERLALAREHFKYFARSFLDRFILWYGAPEKIAELVQVHGVEHLDSLRGRPVIVLAPHFIGMDAGGTRLTFDRQMATLYGNQKNRVLNNVMLAGRARFSGAILLSRLDGLRETIRVIRQGVPFYFLPDMDLGARDSMFVPFFGIPAATVTSVARLAAITGAQIVPCVTTMTSTGYSTRLYPAWQDFPSGDLRADTERCNRFIEERVRENPAQYLWIHKRFKTRPPGEPDFYRRSVCSGVSR